MDQAHVIGSIPVVTKSMVLYWKRVEGQDHSPPSFVPCAIDPQGFLGDMEFKQNKFLPAEKQIVTANPDINTVELCDDDNFIVLACDGIWDCMSSQQLVDFIHEQLKSESKLSAVCERVLDRCLAPSTAGGEGCDNMTMILVQFKKPFQSGASAVEELPASSETLPASDEATTETKPAECGPSS